jgi:hypothetical protein
MHFSGVYPPLRRFCPTFSMITISPIFPHTVTSFFLFLGCFLIFFVFRSLSLSLSLSPRISLSAVFVHHFPGLEKLLLNMSSAKVFSCSLFVFVRFLRVMCPNVLRNHHAQFVLMRAIRRCCLYPCAYEYETKS